MFRTACDTSLDCHWRSPRWGTALPGRSSPVRRSPLAGRANCVGRPIVERLQASRAVQTRRPPAPRQRLSLALKRQSRHLAACPPQRQPPRSPWPPPPPRSRHRPRWDCPPACRQWLPRRVGESRKTSRPHRRVPGQRARWATGRATTACPDASARTSPTPAKGPCPAWVMSTSSGLRRVMLADRCLPSRALPVARTHLQPTALSAADWRRVSTRLPADRLASGPTALR